MGPGEASAGLAFVDSVAGVLGAPYVVNMSFGTHISAHDGTSLEERFIDKTIGGGISGKAVVVSAGNEGANYGAEPFIHCAETLAVGERAFCEVLIPHYTPAPGHLNDGMILDMWYGGEDAMTVIVRSPSGETLEARKGEIRSESGADGSVFIDNAYFTDPLNSDNECFIQIDDGAGFAPGPGTWTIEVPADEAAGDGRFDIWLAYSSGLGSGPAFTGDSPIANERLVASPGNAIEAITVGSYVNRESWLDIDNNTIFFDTLGHPSAGGIAPGSSPGPSRDGRLKPELAAPGRAVISTLSRDAYPGTNSISIFDGCPPNAPRCLVAGDGRHSVARGTSFAAAQVAGAAALLLEMRPDLDAEMLKAALALTARPQGELGGPWGYGKMDALAAAEAVSASNLFDAFEAAYTADNVLVSWSISEGEPIEELLVQRAGSVQGPYAILHSSSDANGSFLDTGVGPDDSVFYRMVVVLPGGAQIGSIPISPVGVSGPISLELLPPFPNPSGATTNVRFISSAAGIAILRAFNSAGRLVAERRTSVPRAGATVHVSWPWIGKDGGDLPSGVYSIVVEVSSARKAAKTVVLR